MDIQNGDPKCSNYECENTPLSQYGTGLCEKCYESVLHMPMCRSGQNFEIPGHTGYMRFLKDTYTCRACENTRHRMISIGEAWGYSARDVGYNELSKCWGEFPKGSQCFNDPSLTQTCVYCQIRGAGVCGDYVCGNCISYGEFSENGEFFSCCSCRDPYTKECGCEDCDYSSGSGSGDESGDEFANVKSKLISFVKSEEDKMSEMENEK